MKELINQNLDVAKLKEHDAIFIKNPIEEDFGWKFNGEEYSIKAGEIKSFSKFVAFHLAKHLSTKMITEEIEKKMTQKQRENRNDPIHGEISQLALYDTPKRRIALFKIFENSDIVTQVILTYPFKGFVGEMNEYQKFVENYVKED